MMEVSPEAQYERLNFLDNFCNEKVYPNWIKGLNIICDRLTNLKPDSISQLKLQQEKETFIRDPIWGEIRLNSFETILLDSFFLQRLRYVSQMGGASFVYPAANHRRFDHSLGTFSVISYVLNEKILKRRSPDYESKLKKIVENYLYLDKRNPKKLFSVINRTDLQEKFEEDPDSLTTILESLPFEHKDELRNWIVLNLKIAMLLHDIGHFPFSHLFEILLKRKINVIKQYREEWIKTDEKATKKGKVIDATHELRTSDFILGKDRIILELIGTQLRRFKEQLDKLGLDTELIANSISGKTTYCLSALVNGSLDADKMDYLARDNYFSIEPDHLKIFDRIYRLAELFGEHDNIKIIFPPKAISSIIKVLVTRSFEFNDIVNHPVQLCFQSLFLACVERVLALYSIDNQAEILKHWELMNDDQFLTSIGILSPDDEIVKNLLYSIKYRELYKESKILRKSEMKVTISLLEDEVKNSFFIDSDILRNCSRNVKGSLIPIINGIIEKMEEKNVGVVVFYNQVNKKFSDYFNNIQVMYEKKSIPLKEYIKIQIETSKKVENTSIDSLVSILDIFSIIDDNLYVYAPKEIKKEVGDLLDKLERDKDQFLWDCATVQYNEENDN